MYGTVGSFPRVIERSTSNNDLREPCEESKLTAGSGKRGVSESGPGSVSSGEPTSVTALVG
jgi:hypothetical protein